MLATAILLGSTSSWAQQIIDRYIALDIPGTGVEPGVTVQSRQRPDYESGGVQYEGFTIRSRLSESIGVDDNVLAQPTHKASALVETDARVQGLFEQSDGSAFVNLGVDDNRYLQQHAQSFTNWSAAIGGSRDIGRDVVTLSYAHLNLNQTPRDLDVPSLDQALAFRIDTIRAAYRAVFSRVFVQPEIVVSNYGYDNGTVAGQVYLQTYRNRISIEPAVTLGYELAPRRNLVLVVRDTSGRYTDQISGLPSRNYDDISVLAGLDFDAGGVLRYRLLAGYERRFFISSQFPTLDGPVLEASVIWTPTGLTSVTGTATRHIRDSADESTAGLTETALGIRVDHELRRDVLLRASAGFVEDEYERGQGSQAQFNVGASATWLISRNVSLTGSYDFTHRDANTGATLGVTSQSFGGRFSEDRALITLRFAL